MVGSSVEDRLRSGITEEYLLLLR